MTALTQLERRQVLIAGIEAHACVNQTAHDLVAAGFQVHVAHDATSSRRREEYDVGWAKMLQAGVVPATVESALLELLRTAEVPEFKAVQRLIR
jgi:nicotinamidase-related amidase